MAMRYLLLAALSAFFCQAADVDGKWVAKMPVLGRDRYADLTFDFKANGRQLSGTVTFHVYGDLPVEDGKIEGDDISFVVTLKRGKMEQKHQFTGRVSGGEILLNLRRADAGIGPSKRTELVAKRAAS
jgi:hypothetical protein